MEKQISTRNALCPDVDFPAVDTKEWKYSGNLLTLGELIGGIRFLISQNYTKLSACGAVSRLAVQHWTERNVYTVCWTTVNRKLLKDYENFMVLRGYINNGLLRKLTVDRYNELKDLKDHVYDISSSRSNHPSAKKRKTELENIHHVKMGPKEYEYLDNQLSHTIGRNDPKKIQCYPHKIDIDPEWKHQQDRRTKRELFYTEQKKTNEKQFETVAFEDSVFTCDDVSDSDYEDEAADIPKKRKYKQVIERINDDLPQEYRHIRDSERKVSDKFYLAAADLIGEGLSLREALKAIEIVSNRCFGRNFKQLVDCQSMYYDKDILPSEKMAQIMVERIEAHGLVSEAN